MLVTAETLREDRRQMRRALERTSRQRDALVERVAALEEELAHALNDHFDALHEVKGAAQACRGWKDLAERYRTQVGVLLERLGKAQACGERCQREAA